MTNNGNQHTRQNTIKTIGLYFHSLSGKGGGAERQLVQLATALASRGHHVHVITWDEDTDVAFYPIPKSVHWHKLGLKAGFLGKLSRLQKLSTTLKDNGIKTLVGFVIANNKVVILGALISGTSLIAAERNGPTLYYVKHNFFSRWINFLSLLFCKRVALQFSDFIDGYPRFLHSRMRVIPNAILPSLKKACPGIPEKKAFQMLFIGRLDSLQKQPTILVNAFAKIADENPDWHLKIVGDGEAWEPLFTLIRALGIADRVTLTPSTLNVGPFYEGADLFVISSLWEGSPNSLAEAMAHGLPAVGFNVDGVSQLIQDKVTGWIVPTIEETALAETLSQAIASPKKLANMGAAAQKATLPYQENMIYDQWQELILSVGKNNGI